MKTVAVIPAYNEGKTVGKAVERARQFVDHVIVVDDGSSDDTAAEAKKTEAEVIVLPRNRGKAQALKVGFKLCKDYDVVVTLDADLQHLPEEIPSLLDGIAEGYDLCLGSRFLNKPRNMPLSCRFSNRVASFLVTLLTRRKITDPQSGFRAIRREKLKQLDLKAERYAAEHIMILEAARKNFKIKEVPISCIYGEEESSIRPLQDTFKVAYCILKFLLRP